MGVETCLSRARVAEIMFGVATKYAEKVAPRQYGQLVKLSDATGDGPITLQIVSYGSKTPEKPGVLGDASGTEAGAG